METILQKKKFQTFIRVFNILLKAVLTLSSLVLGIVILLLASVSIMPIEKITSVLEKGEISATLNLAGLNITVSERVVSNLQFEKQPVLALLALFVLYLVIVLFITYCVQSILKELKNNQVFTVKNSKSIEWIAYGFIIMSFTIQPIQTMIIYLFDQIFYLSSFMENSEWIESISYNFFHIHWTLLFGGVVIWIIGRVFKYGVFLQEEFDATL